MGLYTVVLATNLISKMPSGTKTKQYLKGPCRGLLFDPCFKLRICTVLHSLMINVSAFTGKARHSALRLQMPSWRLGELAGSRMQLRGCQAMEGKQRTFLCYGLWLLFCYYFSKKYHEVEHMAWEQQQISLLNFPAFENRENVMRLGRSAWDIRFRSYLLS